MNRHRLLPLATLLCALGPSCTTHEDGLQPVGGAAESVTVQKRFLRRLYLDLAGTPPSDAALQEGLDRLARDGNTAATRDKLAAELLGQPAFARGFVAELEGRLFAGEAKGNTYNLLCAFFRNADTSCQLCAPPRSADLCEGCECARIQSLAAEQKQLDGSAADLAARATTVEIEGRYAGADGYRFRFGMPEALAQGLFQDFLGRAASPDEERNAAAMDIGALLGQGYQAGVLFHRYGKSYADLVGILFSSEVYTDALVDRVFLRYLGRNASARERAHFVAGMDPPDARPIIRAVVSSREYYIQ